MKFKYDCLYDDFKYFVVIKSFYTQRFKTFSNVVLLFIISHPILNFQNILINV